MMFPLRPLWRRFMEVPLLVDCTYVGILERQGRPEQKRALERAQKHLDNKKSDLAQTIAEQYMASDPSAAWPYAIAGLAFMAGASLEWSAGWASMARADMRSSTAWWPTPSPR